MLKRLAIFGVALLTLFPTGSPRKPGETHQGSAELSPAQAITIIDNSTRPAQANTPAQKTPEPHAGIEWSNWALVLVACLTFVAVFIQAKESTKATKAMLKGIEVQQAEFIQWVDVTDWSITPATHIDFQLAGEVVVSKPEMVAVRISYSVVNNTPRPLFIKEVKTKLQFIPSNVTRVWVVSEKREVVPKGDYKVIIDTKLEGFQVDLYVKNRCAIPAIVEVQFANALGEPASADFMLFVTGGISAVSSTSKGYVSNQVGDDEKGIV